MKIAILAALAAFFMSGCATGNLSPEGELALETTVRIAVRHALDTPRAVEKARNIRSVGERLRTELRADVTVATLVAKISEDIDELGLDPISEADAHDLLRLLSAMIERQVGTGDLKPEGVVVLADFLDLVLETLPEV